VAAAILAYRAIYFLLPLLLSTALLAVFEIRNFAGKVSPTIAAVWNATASWLTPNFVGVAVFGAGTMLMLSGTTPSFGLVSRRCRRCYRSGWSSPPISSPASTASSCYSSFKDCFAG
jgi:hypothetical protein